MFCTSSKLPTSPATWIASPPAALISSATRRSAALFRAFSTTRAPRFAARRAVTRPMPDEAPVITITWSDSFLSFRVIRNSTRATSLPRTKVRVWADFGKFSEDEDADVYFSDTFFVLGIAATTRGAATECRSYSCLLIG